jgi:hypothetical protein
MNTPRWFHRYQVLAWNDRGERIDDGWYHTLYCQACVVIVDMIRVGFHAELRRLP